MLESCKFGVGPFSCVRIDCRCRRRPEARSSWSKTRIRSSETAKYKESQWKFTEITDWCDLFVQYSWMMPNNIKKQCQTYQIKKIHIYSDFPLRSCIFCCSRGTNPGFDQEYLVSGLLRQRQTIRTYEKCPTWNLQVSSMPLKKVLFFRSFGTRSAL